MRQRLRRVVVRIDGQILDLDVDAHPGAGRESLSQVGHVRRQRLALEGDDQAAVRQVGIVVNRGGAIGRPAHIELDPIRGHRSGAPEGRDRVLGVAHRDRSTPVGNDEWVAPVAHSGPDSTS